jgi:hypothetical protein
MKTTKINLLQSKTLPLSDTFDRNQKYNVGSSESRSLIRISERGVSKYILLKLTCYVRQYVTFPTEIIWPKQSDFN